MDVGQNGRPRGPQMEMSSLVLTIQLLGYLILTHTHMHEGFKKGARDREGEIPSGYVKIAIEIDHRHNGFSHEKWSISIATLNYQRVQNRMTEWK